MMVTVNEEENRACAFNSKCSILNIILFIIIARMQYTFTHKDTRARTHTHTQTHKHKHTHTHTRNPFQACLRDNNDNNKNLTIAAIDYVVD